MSFEEPLRRFLAVPGALGAAFLDPQGETIAQVGNPEAVELLGAYQSVWLAELSRAARRSGLGELLELAIDLTERRIVSTEVKDGYFVLVVLEPRGLLAPVRARLEDVRRSLAAEI